MPAEASREPPLDPEESPEPIEIPFSELSPDALRGVVESFVLREGTEYGERDYSLDEKVAHVMRQLERNEARILFDPASESITLLIKDR
jgi:uncharacterized protein YheU (UPF0270 family)